jgi:tetratricopeptide (TPR) repeat protein
VNPLKRGTWRAALGLGAVLILPGCASLVSFSDPADRVSDALREHRYRDALAIIDRTDQDHPQYGLLTEQRRGVLQASREYRQERLALARDLSAREDWGQAYQLLEDTGDRVAEPEPVNDVLAQLREREAGALRERLNQWYLAQAKALLDTDELDRALAHHDDRRATKILGQRARLRQQVSDGLTELGDAYADQALWRQALVSLEMAQRLTPDRSQPASLKRARKTLDSARDRARDARQETRYQHAETLISRYQQSGRLEDLLAARTYLAQHDDAYLDTMRKQVKRWSQDRFARAMAQGEALYAKGEYRAAHQLWQRVAPLDPENLELQKKLERSERVIRNLESLTTP